jgi:heme-NO-binding protein
MAKTKGTAVVQCVKALRSMPPEVTRAKLPPHLHRYLEERILVSNWYPEEDYLALVTALSELLPSSNGDTWELFGRIAAQHDLTTVYRSTVRQRTLMGMLKAVRDLFHMYHDTGRIEISGDETCAQMDTFEYASISAGHCRFITSYIREQLRMSLGRAIEVRETLCRAAGDDRCRRQFVP